MFQVILWYFLLLDVNMAFQQAARQVLLEDDSLLQHFSFTLNTPDPATMAEKSKTPSHLRENYGTLIIFADSQFLW